MNKGYFCKSSLSKNSKWKPMFDLLVFFASLVIPGVTREDCVWAWYTTVCHCILLFTIVCHFLPLHTIVYHCIQLYILVYHYLRYTIVLAPAPGSVTGAKTKLWESTKEGTDTFSDFHEESAFTWKLKNQIICNFILVNDIVIDFKMQVINLQYYFEMKIF